MENKMLWGSDKNAVIALISINLVVFVFFRMMLIIFGNDPELQMQDYNALTNQFFLPSNISIFLQKPWTLITYFFTNTKLFLLITNMIWLFAFSSLLQNFVSNKYLVPSYIYGGLIAGLVYILTNSILGNSNNYLQGSTPAILSVAATTVGFMPHYKLFPNINKGISLWMLFVVFIIVDIASIARNDAALIPAHIAAIAVGYLYAKLAQKGTDLGAWMHRLYIGVVGKPTTISKPNKNDLFYESPVVPFTKKENIDQAKIDAILDKINLTGLNSLTPEEVVILQKSKDKLE